jgi:hypothetical protein
LCTRYNIMLQSLSVTIVFSGSSCLSSTNKTDRHNITEILLQMGLNTIIPQRNIGPLFVQILDQPCNPPYSIITLLPFFIVMLQYDWLWSGHMIIKEMFYIPMKLKPELAHASMTTSDVNNQWRSNFQQQII